MPSMQFLDRRFAFGGRKEGGPYCDVSRRFSLLRSNLLFSSTRIDGWRKQLSLLAPAGYALLSYGDLCERARKHLK